MPTIAELKTLYEKGRGGARNMTPLLKTTAWLVWLSTSPSSFNFKEGGSRNTPTHSSAITYERAFAVRSRR